MSRDDERPVGEVDPAGVDRAAFLDHVTDGFLAVDDDWQFTYVNERAERLLDREADDLLGEVVWDEFPAAADSEFRERYETAVETGEPVEFETRYDPLDAWFDVRAVPTDEGLSVFFREVTERRERERLFDDLNEATERLHDARTPGAVCEAAVTAVRDVLELPMAACWLYDEADGLLRVEAATDPVADAVTETFSVSDAEWEVFLEGEPGVTPVGDRRDDHPLDEALAFPLGSHGLLGAGAPDADGYEEYRFEAGEALAAHVTAALDRAEREEILRDRERELGRYKTIVQTAGDPIYTLDPDGRLTDVNEAMAELTGYDRDRLEGAHASLLLSPEGVQACRNCIQELLKTSGGRETVEVSIETADGEVRPCEFTIALLPRPDGEFQGTVGVVRDLTERRQREQRLAVLDRVLRHNLRNKMNVIVGRVDEIRDAGDGQRVLDNADAIETVAEDLLALSDAARRFQDALSPEQTRVREQDAADIVADVVEDVRAAVDGADVETSLPAAARVRASVGIEMAIEELVENAVEHGAGPVEVAVRRNVDSVSVTVSDEGPGIPEEELTALSAGIETPLEHGSGMGLWLVNWTVEQSGGDVAFEHPDGGGTRVSVELPAVED